MRNTMNKACVATLLSMVALVSALQGAAVQWSGGPIVSGNVVDQNLNISGANILDTTVQIFADTTDILVTVTGGDSSITSTVDDVTLCLRASSGRTITMDLTNALDFIAASNLTRPFLVTFEGPGSLVVQIEGNSRFGLLTNNATVGTRFFLIMDPANPSVTFQHHPAFAVPNADSSVIVASNCMMSYLATIPVSAGTSTEQGRIIFDTTLPKTNTGRLTMVILDRGSVIVGGHLVEDATCPDSTIVTLQTPAGQLATMQVNNSNAPTDWSGLVVANQNQTYSPNLLINPFCTNNYTGLLYGFTLQANGAVTVQDQAYMIYAGGALNVPPVQDQQISGCGTFLQQVVKDRNPSAFIVDGNTIPQATPAQINLQGESAIYFASTVSCANCPTLINIDSQTGNLISTMNSADLLKGAGNILFDVEGELNVIGDASHASALNFLSLVVSLTGGSVLIESSSTNFPNRTYLLNAEGQYQHFQLACMLTNNIVHLIDTNIKHDDALHNACVQFLPCNSTLNDPQPTYIGGERDVLLPSSCITQQQRLFPPNCSAPQNVIELINSSILVHTNLAATGFTFSVPNVPVDNVSQLKFYSNGLCIDQGKGRCFVLGSVIGATASDGSHVIDPSAQLDVIQTVSATTGLQELLLTTSYNNTKVTQGITGVITGQDVVHSIVQLYGSNICVGTNQTVTPSPFPLTTFPLLEIAGNFFSFITQGGALKDPSSAASNGQGAIFVDSNGTLAILPNLRTLMGTMVAKSGNGIVDLPTNEVLFWQTVGIQQTALTLSDPAQQLIVGAGERLSDYTLDWANATKDFCQNPLSAGYVPYLKPDVNTTTSCVVLGYQVPVVSANLQSLPTVRGRVDQLQVKNSTVGDRAAFVVDGGWVRELVSMNSTTPGVTAVATAIIQDDGILGVGSASRNIDSAQAAITLGVNGLTLVANGDGQVILNQDVIVTDLCAILTGTRFGATGPQQLLITSEVPREFRIKSEGILDLTQFTNYNQRLAIGGQVNVVFEPGSTLVQGSGEFFFLGDAQMTAEPYVDFNFTSTWTGGTDAYRVRFLTVDTNEAPSRLTFKEGSTFFIPRGALVGVETDGCITNGTNQSWLVTDEASIQIGNDAQYGGALQIGNVVNRAGSSVSWALTLDGLGALLEINSQGFLGTGLGVVTKPNLAPDNWLIGSLFNVANIAIADTNGTISNRTIYPGSDANASLIGFGPLSGTYSLSFDRNNGEILGGGNLLVTGSVTGPFSPVVGTLASTTITTTDTNGAPLTYGAGILSSQTCLLDVSKTSNNANPVVVSGSPLTLFTYLAMNDYEAQDAKTTTVARIALGTEAIGYVANTATIFRQIAGAFRYGGASIGPNEALEIGTAGLSLNLNDPNNPAASLTVLNP